MTILKINIERPAVYNECNYAPSIGICSTFEQNNMKLSTNTILDHQSANDPTEKHQAPLPPRYQTKNK